ncbi:MAG: TolC family protein [Geobacteraceae bacterium]|nr:TolC family protein [Geobacteraceae bacterium]
MQPLPTESSTANPENSNAVPPFINARKTLSDLVGKSEISVMADLDGQFIQSISENRIFENESTGKVDGITLSESVLAGRSFSRDSHAAMARTEQAKAQTGQVLALLLPSISINANYGTENSQPSVAIDPVTKIAVASDSHSRTDFSLTVKQPIFDLPSYLDWRRRGVLEKSRSENFRASDGDAYVSAVNVYLTLLSSRLQIDMTRDFESQLSDLLTYIEKRAAAGAASVADMNRVVARKQATISSRLELESAHASAGIDFVRLTNIVPQKIRVPVPDDVGATLLPLAFEKAVPVALKFNPEIASLNAELQAAEMDMSVAKSRYLPRVDAEYTDTYSQHAGGEPSAAGQRDKRLMVVLNWSLFNGGSDYKGRIERTERRKELLYRLDDQRRRVIQTLSANYAILATTRERISSGYLELKSISSAADAMSKRMLSGNQSLLDLLDVYDRYLQVRSRLVTLHVLEMSTVTQLIRLTLGSPKAAIAMSS